MKLTALAVSLMAFPVSAIAAPVTLELYGEDFVLSPANQGLQGFFPEAGFLVTGESNEFIFPGSDEIYDLSRIGDGATGIDVGVNRVVFSPQSGATFDLEAVSIDGFYIGVYAEYSARDSATGEGLYDVIPLLYENTYLRGFKAGGEVVTARFLPYDFGNFAELTPPDVPSFAFASNEDPTFGPGVFGPGFEDLLALEVSTGLGLFGTLPLPVQPAECLAYNLARVDPRFALSGFCTGTVFPGSTLEDIEVRVDQLGLRNDALFISLNGISVSMDDAPAPIPVPAALPMLASALVLMGAGGLHRSRRHRVHAPRA